MYLLAKQCGWLIVIASAVFAIVPSADAALLSATGTGAMYFRTTPIRISQSDHSKSGCGSTCKLPAAVDGLSGLPQAFGFLPGTMSSPSSPQSSVCAGVAILPKRIESLPPPLFATALHCEARGPGTLHIDELLDPPKNWKIAIVAVPN